MLKNTEWISIEGPSISKGQNKQNDQNEPIDESIPKGWKMRTQKETINGREESWDTFWMWSLGSSGGSKTDVSTKKQTHETRREKYTLQTHQTRRKKGSLWTKWTAVSVFWRKLQDFAGHFCLPKIRVFVTGLLIRDLGNSSFRFSTAFKRFLLFDNQDDMMDGGVRLKDSWK